MNYSEKCKLWIKASVEEHLTDNTYDVLSYQLSRNYKKLPKWFKSEIPKQNLEMGSVFDIQSTVRKIYRDIF